MPDQSRSGPPDDSSQWLAFWSSRYQQNQTGWDRGGPSPALLAWLEQGRLAPCRLLAPGCGRGHEVVELARRGFEVTAVDFAAEPVEHLRAALQGQELPGRVERSDLFAYQPAAPFDAIYEQTCLCALPPERWAAYAARLHQWLQPGGLLFALFMQTGKTGGPPFDCPPHAMLDLFPADLWAWPTDSQEIAHPAGLVEIAFVLQKR